MADAGKTYVEVIPNLDSFGSQLKAGIKPAVTSAGSEISKGTSKWGGRFKSALGTVGKAAGIGFGVAAVAAVKFGKDSIDAYKQSAQVGAQTNAVIKSTAGAAGVTSQHVTDLANTIRNYSGIEDEAVQSGANMLLTFKNIKNGVGAGNQVFDSATKTLADMSAALGKDPSTAAIQLGKALNDPVKGITALTRVGVTFDDQQKKQIASFVKAGKTADAQKVILKELSSEFGGSAKAMGKANPAGIIQSQIGDVEETVGKTLLPIVGSVLKALQPLLVQLGPLLGKVFAALAPALTSLLNALIPVAEVLIKALAPILADIAPLFDALAPSIEQIALLLTNLLTAILPVLPVLVQIVADVLPLVAVLLRLANAILGPVIKALGFFLKSYYGVMAAVVHSVASWQRFSAIVSAVWRTVAGAVSTAFGTVRRLFASGLGALRRGWDHFWSGLKSAASGIWDGIQNVIRSGVNGILNIVNGAIRVYNRIPFVHDIAPVGLLPMLARGAANFPGGAAIVGDAGPELLQLPRGSRVAPFGGGLGIVGQMQITNWQSGRVRLRGDMAQAIESDRQFRGRRARVG